jgi:hypothetical protein
MWAQRRIGSGKLESPSHEITEEQTSKSVLEMGAPADDS